MSIEEDSIKWILKPLNPITVTESSPSMNITAANDKILGHALGFLRLGVVDINWLN